MRQRQDLSPLRFFLTVLSIIAWAVAGFFAVQKLATVAEMTFAFSPYDFFGYLVAGFLVVCSTEYAVGGDWVPNRDLKIPQAAFWVGAASIIGHKVPGTPVCNSSRSAKAQGVTMRIY